MVQPSYEDVAGIRAVASATLGAGGASDSEVSLAILILEKTGNPDTATTPREIESIAGQWRRHMDALIDAVDATRDKPNRQLRQSQLSIALDAAQLVVMDRDVVAGFFAKLQSQRASLEQWDAVAADVAGTMTDDQRSALEFLDKHLPTISEEHKLQWSIFRRWATGSGIDD